MNQIVKSRLENGPDDMLLAVLAMYEEPSVSKGGNYLEPVLGEPMVEGGQAPVVTPAVTIKDWLKAIQEELARRGHNVAELMIDIKEDIKARLRQEAAKQFKELARQTPANHFWPERERWLA